MFWEVKLGGSYELWVKAGGILLRDKVEGLGWINLKAEMKKLRLVEAVSLVDLSN